MFTKELRCNSNSHSFTLILSFISTKRNIFIFKTTVLEWKVVKSFVQVLRNSSIAVVTLTKRLVQVTISTLISIYSDLIKKKTNITPEKVIFNALFQQSEQNKLANQLRALMYIWNKFFNPFLERIIALSFAF